MYFRISWGHAPWPAPQPLPCRSSHRCGTSLCQSAADCHGRRFDAGGGCAGEVDGLGWPLVCHLDTDARVRREYRNILAKTGRWLTAKQPTIATPADWTREICTAWVARVVRIGIGDFAQRRVGRRLGRRLVPSTMASYISAARTLLRDCQEWGWCTRRFDPATALATPRSLVPCSAPSRKSLPTTPGQRSCGRAEPRS